MEMGDGAQRAEPAGDGVPAGLASVAALRAAAEADLDAALWQLSDAQAREGVAGIFGVLQQVQAAYLRRVADLDSRPGAVSGAKPGMVARTFLVHKLHRNPWDAQHDVRAAHAVNPDADPALGGLPRLGAALAAGDVSREHADAAVKAMRRLPAHLLREPAERPPGEPASEPAYEEIGHDDERPLCRGDFVDQLLTRHAMQHSPGTVDKLACYLQRATDPEGATSFDPDAVTRRRVSMFQDWTGMTIVRGELDQANGAVLRAAVDAFSRPDPARSETADDGAMIEIIDQRSPVQRAADALGIIARIALGSGRAGSRGGEAPRVLIHTDVETLAAVRAAGIAAASAPAQGHSGKPVPSRTVPSLPPGQLATFGTGDPVDPAMLAGLACDSILQRALLAPSGAVLDLGRDERSATPAQRRALTARDHGCVVPGCTAPAAWCHCHHVRWWSKDGSTDLENMALVCPHHHTDIHLGIWDLQFRDGLPWAIPPPWIDENRRAIRNTAHDDAHTAYHLGTQLRLGFHEPSQTSQASPSGEPGETGGADPPIAA